MRNSNCPTCCEITSGLDRVICFKSSKSPMASIRVFIEDSNSRYHARDNMRRCFRGFSA